MILTIRARLLWLVGIALLPAVAILIYDQYLFRQQVFRQIQADEPRNSLVLQNLRRQQPESRLQQPATIRVGDVVSPTELTFRTLDDPAHQIGQFLSRLLFNQG